MQQIQSGYLVPTVRLRAGKGLFALASLRIAPSIGRLSISIGFNAAI
jgi:hypothetical protein